MKLHISLGAHGSLNFLIFQALSLYFNLILPQPKPFCFFFLRKRLSRLLIQELENHKHKNYKDEQTPSKPAKEKIISHS